MAGCSLRLCIEAGLGPDCFRPGFPCPFKVSELKDSGFTCTELKDAGFTDATWLARAGFTTSELEAAGFERHEAAASIRMAATVQGIGMNDANASRAGIPVKAPPWPFAPWAKGGQAHQGFLDGLWPSVKGKGKGQGKALLETSTFAFPQHPQPRPYHGEVGEGILNETLLMDRVESEGSV